MADENRDDREEVQLPPAFLKFQGQLKADRKALLRDKAYAQSPEQLRAFIAQFLFPRLDEFVGLMGLALYDTYGLAVSSENQIQRMRSVYGKALKKLGADVEDETGDLPGVSPDVLDEFQQYFYALGTLLSKKLPDDKEVQEAFNKCAESLGDMVADLMGEEDDDDDDDDGDDDDDDEEEGGEAKPPRKKSPKKKATEAAEEEDEGSSKPNSDPSDEDGRIG
jgi:hypothetical protein